MHLAFHPGMGPGGVLWRWNEGSPWNSMETTCEFGVDAMRWPQTLAKLPVLTGGIYSSTDRHEVKYQLLHTAIPVPRI